MLQITPFKHCLFGQMGKNMKISHFAKKQQVSSMGNVFPCTSES